MHALLAVALWLALDVLLVVALVRIARAMRASRVREAAGRPGAAAISLRGGVTAPARARTELTPMLGACHDDVAYSAKLLVSELVSNSVVHDGAGETELIAVHVHAADAALRIEVRNPRRRFRPDAERGEVPGAGRGLQIVDALAESWGIEHGDVSRAWFELRTHHDPSRTEAMGTI